MTQHRSTLRDEIAIIPKTLYLFVPVAFACALFLLLVYMPGHDPKAPPYALRVLLSLVLGVVLSIYLGLVGYVNQDAKRRNMGQLLWTLLVIFVPNCLGFLAYFLLRKPIPEKCPQCGELASRDFRFCTRCGCGLQPTCPHCGQSVQRDYIVCPYCGKTLSGTTAAPGPTA